MRACGRLAVVVGLVGLMAAATPARAQEDPQNEWGLLFGVGFPDRQLTGLPMTLDRAQPSFGLRGAFQVHENVLLFGDVTATRYNEGLNKSLDITEYAIRIGPEILLPWIGEHSRFFVSGALGAATFDPNHGSTFTRGLASIGFGQRFVTKSYNVFRWELRGENTLTDAGRGWPRDFSNVQLLLGYSWGTPPPDSDGDGVIDRKDKCPNTPHGATVDAQGCPTDSDGDGVYDGIDQCPNTPHGAKVDARGCPMDSDGDGVYDGIDQCPDTPVGATVDARGCPMDSDGDGVYDGIDQCPDTPHGATVDAKGCPMDSDGDGVYDGIDQCPDTPPGTKVDERGCPVKAPPVFEQGKTSLVLEGVHFASDKYNLTPESDAILMKVVQSLKDWPDVRVEVAGYTDSTNTMAYNQKLSERRAKAVYDFLVDHGIDPSRLTAKGYGETQPVADNGTPEGRAKNRRVELHRLD